MYALSTQGHVFVWGANTHGALGVDSTAGKIYNDRSPVLLPFWLRRFEGLRIVQVAATTTHMLALDQGGKVYVCGSGDKGQLGLGQVTSFGSPRLVEAIAHVPMKQIAVGKSHSMALATNGDVYCWGLLAPNDNPVRLPTLVAPLRKLLLFYDQALRNVMTAGVQVTWALCLSKQATTTAWP